MVTTTTLTKPKILVILGNDHTLDLSLGNDHTLDLSVDQAAFKSLEKQGAQITCLMSSEDQQLTRQQLIDALSTKRWDILFFAGHSYSFYDPDHEENGIILLSEGEEISLKELRTYLQQSAQNGLKIAIFNSCDGLFLARNCATFNIPNIIFMKEPIPDPVAHEFLKAFLSQFSQQKSLAFSLRYSREILKDTYEQSTSKLYLPGIHWLPTLYQNPDQSSISWKPRKSLDKWRTLGLTLLAILAGGLGYYIYDTKIHTNPFNPDLRFSSCDKLLISKDEYENLALIQKGIKACQSQQFVKAVDYFKESRSHNKNKPEIVIYKNNAEAVKHNPLKIAVVVPIGSNKNIAEEMLRGVAQAQVEINKQGGINGRYLHITIVNDSNDPEEAKQVAHKLVNAPEIIAIIGHNASNASLAAAPIYQQGQIVMINPTSFANGISKVGKYIFRSVPNIKYAAQSLAEYIIKKYPKSQLAICYDEQAIDGVSYKDVFILEWDANKGTMIPTVCNFSQPGFNPNEEMIEAVNSGADSLLVIPHIDRLEQAYKLAEANQNRLKLFGNNTLGTFKTLAHGQYTNGMTLSVPWNAKNPENASFAQKARLFWGGDVSWRTATSYDATYAIAEGLKKGQTREELQKALENPQFVAKTDNGEIKFTPDRDRDGKAMIIQVQPSSSHETGYDFQVVSPLSK